MSFVHVISRQNPRTATWDTATTHGVSSTHTVYRIHESDSQRRLEQAQEPIPTIDKYEVLIKIRGISLNFRDVAILAGKYPFLIKDKVIPCSDAAGEVIEVGSSVVGFEVGDRVIASFDPTNLYGPQPDWNHSHGGAIDGMLRQYIALPGSAITKIPAHSNLSFPQMSALVCTGVTAWNALYGNIPLKPGQTVLFQGTGGVSITGLILAKAAGAVTIITSSSDEKLALVREKYGADHVINYRTTPNWSEEVNRITDGRGADYILENGGSGTIAQSVGCVAMGGIINAIGFLSPAKELPDVSRLVLSKGCIYRGIAVGSKQLLGELVRFVVARGLVPPVEKTFGFSFEEVERAYEYLRSGEHIGKVCIALD